MTTIINIIISIQQQYTNFIQKETWKKELNLSFWGKNSFQFRISLALQLSLLLTCCQKIPIHWKLTLPSSELHQDKSIYNDFTISSPNDIS